MRKLSKPTIAVLNGYALGVGATMPLLCDMRIAAAEAQIGFLFSRMGVMAELGSTYLLPRLVGTARACELMLTGKRFSAAECERMGLVNRVVPRAELTAAARAIADEIASARRCRSCSPARRSTRAWRAASKRSCASKATRSTTSTAPPDHAEAVAAFREKRAPTFGEVKDESPEDADGSRGTQ